MTEVTHRLVLPAPADLAFRVFTDGFGAWWPREYTWSGPVLAGIGMERGAGGLCYEYGPHGFRCDWGRVLIWDPPRRLIFTWQIGPDRVPLPDPTRASEVEVRFHETGPTRTIMEFVHRGFERLADGDAFAAALAAPQGWPYILGLFAKACARPAPPAGRAALEVTTEAGRWPGGLAY